MALSKEGDVQIRHFQSVSVRTFIFLFGDSFRDLVNRRGVDQVRLQ